MKYSYFCPMSSGKYQIRQIFLNNNKTHCLMCCGHPPVYAVMMTPDYKWDWYWENLDGELVHETYQDKKPKDGEEWREHLHGYHDETWYYRKTDGEYSIKKLLKRRPELRVRKFPQGDFQKCFKHAFESDMIVNPLVMLGYAGVLGGGNFGSQIQQRKTNMHVDLEYVVEELRKRQNYVTIKEDIRRLAFNFFTNTTRPPFHNEKQFVEQVHKNIENNKRFEKIIAELLNYYKIPYEWFNLDKDDYSVFGVDDIPERNITDNLFKYDGLDYDKVNQWVNDFLNK